MLRLWFILKCKWHNICPKHLVDLVPEYSYRVCSSCKEEKEMRAVIKQRQQVRIKEELKAAGVKLNRGDE